MPDSTSPPADVTPYLSDLERRFDQDAGRAYDPVELVRLALTFPTDYWPDLALDWLDQGVPVSGLVEELAAFESEPSRPQTQRHRARRLRKGVQG